MTRTIYVVFPTEVCGDTKSYSGASKKYAFLCNYDEVETGDIIVDPRYTDAMFVVDISDNTNRYLNGIPLKEIYITSINNIPISQPSGLVNGVRIGSDFDIDKERANKYLGENDRIHCSTLEEARKVIDFYYTLGYKWEVSNKGETNYHGPNTVYSIEGINKKTIKIGYLDTAEKLDRNIISAKEFINYYITKDMEKRNIKVSLEEAREWYNSGNEILRTLALTVFTEEEIVLNFDYIKETISSVPSWVNVPKSDCKKYEALANLAMIAKYFNGAWKKTPSNTGYFLGQANLKFYNGSNIEIKGLSHIGVCTHNTVMYPGIVYFKSPDDIIKAVKIMGDKIKDLFK